MKAQQRHDDDQIYTFRTTLYCLHDGKGLVIGINNNNMKAQQRYSRKPGTTTEYIE